MRVGIYNRWLPTLGGGERYSLSIAEHLSRQHAVTVISHQPADRKLLADLFDLDLSAIRFNTVPDQPACDLGYITTGYDLFINASQGDIVPAHAPSDLLVVYFPMRIQLDVASRLRRSIGLVINRYMTLSIRERVIARYFKEWNLRLNSIPKKPDFREDLDTYNSIWAISEFSRKWINIYWNRTSVVVYPPVAIHRFAPRVKRNQIISVGRFFAGSHNKKHHVMIEAFKEMVDVGLTGWELHLVGQVARGIEHEQYLEQVRASCAGYPIVVHTNVGFNKLADMYGESVIYWHASGYGEDEDSEPIKLEHFGISTVEAMASGCVPIVIGSGGQTEIVQHGESGFLWRMTRDLKDYSWQVITDPRLRVRLMENAVQRSQSFSRATFEKRLDDLLVTDSAHT
ncbi:MAG: glycosyltransferase [Chloroflexi bacterium]|nr:glycosyltransferase [Chloroflexota bacterium]MCL5275881.1 glycosyltransferase [Chloroflexota bacterium]